MGAIKPIYLGKEKFVWMASVIKYNWENEI